MIHDEHADYGSGDDVTIMLTAWLMLLRFIIVFSLGASSGCFLVLYVCLFVVSACAFGVKSGAPALRAPGYYFQFSLVLVLLCLASPVS